MIAMHWIEAASAFSALASDARLEVLRTLVRAGPTGLTVGEIQERTNMAPSTLAHHLKFLVAGEVVEQIREGRSIRNRASFERLEAIARFILFECCADEKQKLTGNG
jgi:DNA-binding transcriptional ArsR family regulator